MFDCGHFVGWKSTDNRNKKTCTVSKKLIYFGVFNLYIEVFLRLHRSCWNIFRFFCPWVQHTYLSYSLTYKWRIKPNYFRHACGECSSCGTPSGGGKCSRKRCLQPVYYYTKKRPRDKPTPKEIYHFVVHLYFRRWCLWFEMICKPVCQ